MLFTLEDVRANLRNKDGKRVFYLGKGDTLTSEARDFLSHERIGILPAAQARPERYALLGGGYMTEKPEHMTHLNAQVLVHKTHPRIFFRSAMDALEAELLLAMLVKDAPRKALQEALDLARKVLRLEVLEEKAEEVLLDGMDGQTLRAHSHRPQDFYGKAHFMPKPEDGAVVLQLNRCRCAARQAELAACRCFTGRDGCITRQDLVQCLNRLSSFLYILMIRARPG